MPENGSNDAKIMKMALSLNIYSMFERPASRASRARELAALRRATPAPALGLENTANTAISRTAATWALEIAAPVPLSARNSCSGASGRSKSLLRRLLGARNRCSVASERSKSLLSARNRCSSASGHSKLLLPSFWALAIAVPELLGARNCCSSFWALGIAALEPLGARHRATPSLLRSY